MARMKKPVTTPSDEKTRTYIMSLMKSLPLELFDLVTELRDTSVVIRAKADVLELDVQVLIEDLVKLLTRLDALENIVHELCDTASKATAIGPLWDIMQERQAETEDD